VLLPVIVLYATLCFAAYFVADRMIFLPPPATYSHGLGTIGLTTADGVQISALHLPNPSAEYTILYSHGNAEDLGLVVPMLERIHDWGFSVFAYDYRGYGTSQGRPSERGVYADIDAAYAYLTERLAIPPERIILYGRSVGSGPAVDLAARQRVGGLILESAFMSAFRVLTRVPLLPCDEFRNLAKIERVSCPILVMHGLEDDIVPVAHGRRLFDAAREPKRALWVPGAGHNDFMLVAGERQSRAVIEFADIVRQEQSRRGR